MGHTTRLIKGQNDLFTCNPNLAKEWHPTKNGDLSPCDVTAHSNKKVWWIGQCGHEWPAIVDSRANGRGCPFCSGQKVLPGFNDLLTTSPSLADEWNCEKNLPLTPDCVQAGSHKHVWWKCKQCGYEWSAEIRMRSQLGQGCPQCGRVKSGDTFRQTLLRNGILALAAEYPQIAKEWHPTKNNPKTADNYTSASSKKVWWKCSICGYEWPATINNRVYRKSGCPLCAGNIIVPGINDLQTKCPAIAAEWHPTKNLPLLPSKTAPFSSEKVWWICRFGHEYKCRVSDRQKGVGCSECSKRFRTSLPERIVEYYINQFFPDTQSNYRPDFLNGAEIDIYIPSISTGIEYDGERYHQNLDRDKTKDLLCHQSGVRLIRIREKKCPVYDRSDPTFILYDQSDASFSKEITSVLAYLGIDSSDVDISQDKQKIMERYRNTAINGSIADDYPILAQEWDPVLNGELKPENIPSTKSHDRYYWKCRKCGYSWPGVLAERIAGTGCPACAGKVVVNGQNDLASFYPLLAQEWHPTKNGTLTPSTVSKGSGKTVWWRCSKCGHEWKARICKRIAGAGCEKCAHQKWGKRQYKKVYQFSGDGKLVNEYPSARIAAEELGISRVSIQHVCNGVGRLKTAGGFFWSYYPEKGKKPAQNKERKKVYQYSADMKFLREFPDAKTAAMEIGVSDSSIRQACNGTNGRKTAGGYVWSYNKDI